MATYVPNATQATEPVESRTVESAALEFRTLKSSVNTRVDNLQAEVDANSAATLRAPLPETTINAIPTQANRSGKFLAFDSVTGQPISGPLITDWTITQAQIGNISTVAGNTTNINTVATNIAAVNSAYANATAAAASATAASTSATNAANSASAASTSASGASGSASAASASASAAAISASNANNSSIQAANSADFAWTSATAASTSATNASNSAISASSYAAIATTQAASASGSASSAATSAGNASVSASNANSHASSASASAANAAASAASASAIVLGVASGMPSIKPTLNLDFANSQTVDPRITFARTGTAVYYDGKTTVMAEQNLLAYSQEFDSIYFNKQNVSVTANSTTAPDATTTADTIADNTTSTSHHANVAYGTSFAASTTYTLSCFLKKGTSNYGYLCVSDPSLAGRYISADFNLDTGVVRTSGAGASGTLTAATITSVGNGWFRCVLVGSISTTTSALLVIFGVSDGTTAIGSFGTISYVGTGSTIYAWGAQLEQRSTVTAYTPTTTAPITNYIPVLQTAASGVPRLDYDPVTFEAKGLLIEEQRTNLLTYSSEFDNAAWVKTNATVTANAIVAPDGTLTADTLIWDTAISIHPVKKAFTYTAASYTFSVYAKQTKIGNNIQIRVRDTVSSGTIYGIGNINLSTGGSIATATGVISSQFVGNGWYRVTLQFTAAAVTAETAIVICDDTGTASLAGDGYSGIYIWGAQLEVGSFATSYIPTTSAQVTRAADSASMTGTNFSSWYRADEGTLFVEYSVASTTGARLASFSPVVVGSYAVMGSGVSGATGWYSAGLNSLGTVLTGYNKQALQYAPNKYFGASLNGGAVVSSSASDYTGASTQLSIGVGNASYANGTIKKLAYYPKRLSNTELQALTA